MDAITAMLSGDVLTDDEKLKQTADALRGSQRAGDFFAMSSIAPLQQLGQTQSARANKAAQRAGVMREAALRRATEAQAAKDELAAQRAAADLEWSRKLGLQKAKDDAAMRRLKAKNAGKSGSSSIGKIPYTALDKFGESAGQYTNYEDIVGRELKFDKDGNPYVEGLAAGGDDQIFEGGIIDEAYEKAKGKFASGMLNEGEKKRKLFWDDYRRFYDYVERHGLFGSALSGRESDDWKEIEISPSDSNEMIARKLAQQREFIRDKFAKKVTSLRMGGVSDEDIGKFLGEYSSLYIDQQPEGQGTAQGSMDGVPSLGLSDEEEAAQLAEEEGDTEIAQDEVTKAIASDIESLGYDPNEVFGLMSSDPDKFNQLLDQNKELDAAFQKYITE